MKITKTILPSPSSNPIHAGTNALNQLRAAGMPIVGVLWPVRAENGTLTVSTDAGGGLVYEWEGEQMEQLF